MLCTKQEFELAPQNKPITAPTPAVKKEDPIDEHLAEIREDQNIKIDPEQARDFDQMIGAAFTNLKASDVVLKLEDLAKVFKTREIPRQLAIVDMMLDSLGLAAYFPSLSEATNKALESNNYISTRIDDILAKLQGSLKTKELDLTGDNDPRVLSQEALALKEKLKLQEEKDRQKKKMRKEQADKELEEGYKKEPDIEIEEDLSEPIAAAPAPTKPITPKL